MENILVVDDVQTDRDILGRIIKAAGHQPVFASDGSQAVSTAKTMRPALVLLDVVMPGQDGYQTCRAIRNDPDIGKVPIVLVTSKGEDTDKFWGKRQGANDVVVKPYEADTITKVIRQYVR